MCVCADGKHGFVSRLLFLRANSLQCAGAGAYISMSRMALKQ